MPRLRHLPLSAVVIPDDTIRTYVDDDTLADLAHSIETLGLLQPIVVRQLGTQWEIVAGLRRYLAHKLLGKDTISAICHPAGYETREASRLVENIQRDALPLIDEAQAVRALIEEHGFSIPETARQLSKSETWVRDRLDVLRLPEGLAYALQEDKISMGAALELAKIPDKTIRDQYTQYAVQSGITAAVARQWKEQAIRDATLQLTQSPDDADPGAALPPTALQVQCFACEQSHDLNACIAVHLCRECYITTIHHVETQHG
jgi:ParB family chromosome partitioning protein